jgi:hypothetical protein
VKLERTSMASSVIYCCSVGTGRDQSLSARWKLLASRIRRRPVSGQSLRVVWVERKLKSLLLLGQTRHECQRRQPHPQPSGGCSRAVMINDATVGRAAAAEAAAVAAAISTDNLYPSAVVRATRVGCSRRRYDAVGCSRPRCDPL